MAVPKFDALMLPMLLAVADGKEHRLNDLTPHIADILKLSPEDRSEKMDSGQPRFRNRVYWAKLYLSQAKAIETVRPGTFRISVRGRTLIEKSPQRVTVDDLMQFPEFREFKAKSGATTHRIHQADKDIEVTIPETNASDSAYFEGGLHEARESHQIQALLASIGSKMGMNIWLPAGDRIAVLREWHGKHPQLIEQLPLSYDSATLKTVKQIDVLWLKGRSIRRAFEVEHTTAIYSGLLRMADLLALQPNMEINLHIVAPMARREKVLDELRRPVFSLLERKPLPKYCTYLSYESIRELAAEPHLSHLSDDVLGDYAEEAEEPT